MRKRSAVLKVHVTLSIDHRVWASFQEESAVRKLTASEQIEKFMSKQLEKWEKEKTK